MCNLHDTTNVEQHSVDNGTTTKSIQNTMIHKNKNDISIQND